MEQLDGMTQLRTDDETQSPGLTTGDSHLGWVG